MFGFDFKYLKKILYNFLDLLLVVVDGGSLLCMLTADDIYGRWMVVFVIELLNETIKKINRSFKDGLLNKNILVI